MITLKDGVNGMVSSCPKGGAGVSVLSKDAMCAINWLFKSK